MTLKRMALVAAACAALALPGIGLADKPDKKPKPVRPPKSAPEMDAKSWAPGLAVLGLALLLVSEGSRRRDS
jgi:hypothetical protein